MNDTIELRATGRTTRLADDYIQELFKNKSITIKDHWDAMFSNRILYFIIKKRLTLEHKGLKYKEDIANFTLTLE